MIVELAEEMRRIGWDCRILCPNDLSSGSNALKSFPATLRAHLKSHAADYDVVDYDHACLPYPRGDFRRRTLFVARSVLLVQHLETICVPQPGSLKAAIGRLIKGRARQQRKMIRHAQTTIEEADLVNVSSEDDKAELMRRGIAENKIIVLPYGISRTRRPLFDAVSSEPPPQPVVVFVGTFDYRKGAREFPALVDSIARSVPGVRFKLLGTAGLFRTAAEVLSHFPASVQQKIEVIPTFQSEDLPAQLACCSVGIFPSYLEGMPFGVLEMLAASVPVVAYDAPGLPGLLSSEYLVPRGDANAMARKVIDLLRDKCRLAEARRRAKQRSQPFEWRAIAQKTSDIYCDRLRTR